MTTGVSFTWDHILWVSPYLAVLYIINCTKLSWRLTDNSSQIIYKNINQKRFIK